MSIIYFIIFILRPGDWIATYINTSGPAEYTLKTKGFGFTELSIQLHKHSLLQVTAKS